MKYSPKRANPFIVFFWFLILLIVIVVPILFPAMYGLVEGKIVIYYGSLFFVGLLSLSIFLILHAESFIKRILNPLRKNGLPNKNKCLSIFNPSSHQGLTSGNPTDIIIQTSTIRRSWGCTSTLTSASTAPRKPSEPSIVCLKSSTLKKYRQT